MSQTEEQPSSAKSPYAGQEFSLEQLEDMLLNTSSKHDWISLPVKERIIGREGLQATLPQKDTMVEPGATWAGRYLSN